MRTEHRTRLSRIKHDLKELMMHLSDHLDDLRKRGKLDEDVANVHGHFSRLEICLEILKEI